MEIIKLRDDYIKLGQALKAANLVQSGVDAKFAIQDGLVKVNGQVQTQRGKKLFDGDIVEFIKLTIADGFASFNAKHFSDYYLVSLSDEAVKAVEDETPAETTTGVNGDTEKPGNDKNDNKPTGIAIALIPAVAAAVSAVVFKKRK